MVEYSVLPRTQAVNRLLIIELALRQFELAYATRPEQLKALVPDFLSRVPADPYDQDGRPFRYSHLPDGNRAYRVGWDSDDDGGRPAEKDEYGAVDSQGNGDLRLDALFAPNDDRDDNVSADASSDSESNNPQ